ncbi:MAG: hypothetical protein RL748_4507 [Pseudomonadota bacterium]
MNKPILTSLLALLVFGAGTGVAQAAEDCFLNGKEVSPDNGATTEGKTGIMQCKDRATGKPTRDKELRAGKFVGQTRDYVDGEIAIEYGRDEHGRDHGVNRKYGRNQQLVFEEHSEHGKVQGFRREWYADGSLKSIEFFGKTEGQTANARYTAKKQINDLTCSTTPLLLPHVDDAALCGFKGKASTVDFFNDEGKLYARETYLAGVAQKSEEFDTASGKLKFIMQVQGNTRLDTYFNADGSKQREEVLNLAEKTKAFVRKAEFHESGQLVLEQKFAMLEIDGKRRNFMVSEAKFYLNGQPQELEVYSVQGRDIVKDAKVYYDNGKVGEQGRFVDDGRNGYYRIGMHQSFWETGVASCEWFYKAKGKMVRERCFDKNGVLERDEEVFEDGSRKAFAK